MVKMKRCVSDVKYEYGRGVPLSTDMNTSVVTHIALQSVSEKDADIFFQKILGCKVIRQFVIPVDLSEKIFGIKKENTVKWYSNENMVFEIFITKKMPRVCYEHICISVANKEDFLNTCNQYGIKTVSVSGKNKNYIFIRDFSGYLYEVK